MTHRESPYRHQVGGAVWEPMRSGRDIQTVNNWQMGAFTVFPQSTFIWVIKQSLMKV